MTTDTLTRDLPWTGERYVPQIGGEIELEHLHRYYWAAQFSSGKSVLDIACGEGYGSEILAGCAARVIGVDLSEETILHAGRKYRRKNLEFLVGSCDRIPIPDGQIDLVVSFETIEHHDLHQEMMQEIKRILSPEGMLIISSPDKYVYSDIPGYKNEFHVKELYAREFEALLKQHFARVEVLGQRVAYGSLIAREGAADFVSFDAEQKPAPAVHGIKKAIFNLAVASDTLLPDLSSGIFERSVTKSPGYEALQQEIETRGSKIAEISHQLASRDGAIAELRNGLATRDKEISDLQNKLERAVCELRSELETRVTANAELRNELASRDGAIAELRNELESVVCELRNELATRVTTIAELRDQLANRDTTILELQEEAAKFRRQVGGAESKIRQLKASLSWRMTWPLRLARDGVAAAVPRAWGAISRKSPTARPASENGETGHEDQGSPEGLGTRPLFDPSWYLQENPDVAKAGIEPLRHYITAGWREGRNPHPLFDVRYYLSQAPNLTGTDADPVAHFLRQGAQEGLKPHPLFDPVWYSSFNSQSMPPGENALVHYITHGRGEGCDPHPSFNISLYLEANPEVRWRSEDPLVHYLQRVRNGSARPMPDIRSEPPDADAPPAEMDVKAIALYLPQFHRIPENDAWWGEGFTEWTNVRRGRPQFWGHYQPHVPHPDIGYYDLTDPGVMEKQAQMARQFGIYGFCFYYYWFNGRRLLEKPTDRFLSCGKPDFPFCFCWANENWTRRWDGEEREVLIGQEHSFESDERFIHDILPALRDKRYIRVNGRPLLAVYRPGLLPDPRGTFAHWREFCRREGLGEIYLAGFRTSFDLRDPEALGLDAAVEFPPHQCNVMESGRVEVPVFNDFRGSLYDYRKIAENPLNYPVGNFTLFRGVMPGWDNTARRQKHGAVWIHSNPQLYCRWLHRAVLQTRRYANPDERLIFINSWNEWAEGAHLEPDERHGYAWLNATRLALETGSCPRQDANELPYVLVISHDAALAGAQVLLVNLLRQWRKRRPFPVRVVCVGTGELRNEFEKCFPTLVLADFATEAEQDCALAKFVRGTPRVIYSSTVVNGPLLAKLRPLGVKIVTHAHELQKSIERWAPEEIMAATLKCSDFFLGGSAKVVENLASSHGVPKGLLDVVSDFIEPWEDAQQPDSAARTAMRNELGIEPGNVVVFGCGTTDWRKGPDLFFETARFACERDGRLKFVWIGGDPSPFMEKVRGAGLEGRILYIGNRKESRRYYYTGHIFLLSSREDPCPLVALEAADAGLPLVCFAGAGDIPGFVGEECGVAVPYEDVQAASQAILQLSEDTELRQAQGAEGRRRARELHSSASAAFQIEALFDRLASDSKAPFERDRPSREEPLVSVIVPNYNHEKYLTERLRSIAGQTYQNMEIILLDDASTDNSLAILQRFSKEESRARFIPNAQNSGSTFKQWRKGLSQARGKYVWIAESDDVAEPEFLETLIEKLEANPGLSLAYCQMQMTSPNGEKLGTPDEPWLSEIDPMRWKTDFINDGIDEIRRSLVVKNTILNASGVVFRNAEAVADLVDDSMRLCADWLFWMRLLQRGGVAYIAKPLSRWRLHSSNARNRPTGELEWREGERVLTEAAEILKLTELERDRILLDFLRKCWKWRMEAVPQEREAAPKK